MKYIIKLLLLTGLVLPAIFASAAAGSAVAEEPIEEAVVIVGSNRTKGTLMDHIVGIVNQDAGDFSHKNSFPEERVISVDPTPCALKELEHIEDDFIKTDRFMPNAQKTVVFEWFPGSDLANLLENQMLKALEKAYDILMPGGILIIDSHPSFAWVDGQKKADLIQRLNPFSLFLTQEEIVQIAECLGLAKNGKKIPQAYRNVYPNITKSINVISNIFGDIKKRKIAGSIFDCMKIKEGRAALIATFMNPIGYMFLWAYHSFSRASIMGAALKKIGFEAEASEIGFAQENPLNKRKNAWIIQIRKPIAAKEAVIDSSLSSAAAASSGSAYQQEEKKVKTFES